MKDGEELDRDSVADARHNGNSSYDAVPSGSFASRHRTGCGMSGIRHMLEMRPGKPRGLRQTGSFLAPLPVPVLLSCTGSGGAPVHPRQACARGGSVPMLLTGQADIVLCQGKT